jgi:hypothetical protein
LDEELFKQSITSSNCDTISAVPEADVGILSGQFYFHFKKTVRIFESIGQFWTASDGKHLMESI